MSVSAGATRVLVVEDEQDIAGLLKHTLEKMGGVDVDVVDTGDAALRVVAERPPDLILLDLNLPKASGLDILARFRQSTRYAQVPVIIMTSSDAKKDRSESAALGATDYFRKPSSYDEFLKLGQVIESLLPISH